MRNLKANNNIRTISKLKGIILLISVTLYVSCNTSTFNTKNELMAFLQEDANGYVQHKTINGVDYSLMYRPTDLLVQQELNDSSTETEIKALRTRYSKYLYFNLSMSQNNKELLSVAPKNRTEFGVMVNQLAFGMGKKVHLFTHTTKDTLDLIDFIYPRMYGMGKATTIMFVYPRDEKQLDEDYLSFTIEDLGLYTGEVKFKIPTDKLKNEPKLSFPLKQESKS